MNPSDESARVAWANERALFALMEEHSILIPAREIGTWRPTQRNIGDIVGVKENARILCTDGVVAWFSTPAGLFHGHIARFTGEVKPLFSVTPNKTIKAKDKKPKPTQPSALPPKTRAKIDLALDLLNSIL